MSIIAKIEQAAIPSHIALIMDGNGRWASEQGKPRTAGHSEGLTTARNIVKSASDLGVKNITLYTFSTENWKRTQDEVKFLMRLIAKHLRKEWNFYLQNGIRVRHTGDMSGLPDYVQKEILFISEKTKDFKHATVNLAINYGGRNETVRAVKKLLKEIQSPDEITEESLQNCLDNPDIPDPELIIRTGGQTRLSNFLIWQSAYSELYFSDKYWPDFSEEDLYNAIYDYQQRKRNFGGTK